MKNTIIVKTDWFLIIHSLALYGRKLFKTLAPSSGYTGIKLNTPSPKFTEIIDTMILDITLVVVVIVVTVNP